MKIDLGNQIRYMNCNNGRNSHGNLHNFLHMVSHMIFQIKSCLNVPSEFHVIPYEIYPIYIHISYMNHGILCGIPYGDFQ